MIREHRSRRRWTAVLGLSFLTSCALGPGSREATDAVSRPDFSPYPSEPKVLAIYGYVVDDSLDTPIEAAIVSSEEGMIGGISWGDGRYWFQVPRSGEFVVRAEKLGFVFAERTVQVDSLRVRLDFRLRPAPPVCLSDCIDAEGRLYMCC